VINVDIDKARGIAKRLGLGPGEGRPRKCIVIGGSPSIRGTALGEYVDQFDGDVIRVNAPANPDYAEDCGSRTDVIFRSEWLDKNVYTSGADRKIIINTQDTLALSEDFSLDKGMFLTTGTLCVVLALSVYDRVETLGFGDDGTKGTDIFVTLHPVPHRDAKKKGSKCPHDIDFEHAALAQLEKGQFCGKLVQLEASAPSKGRNSRRMSCWDRFDRKTLVTFTGNRYTRVPGLVNELRRVGMDGFDVLWQFPNPFNAVLMNSVKHDKWIHHGGYFNCTMGHYRAIQTAYNLGCSEALFMEDDIRFLKDTGEISEIVNSLPKDYDLATFDPSYRSWPTDQLADFLSWRERRKVNEHWAEFDAMFSMGCYALSRKGMEKMLACYDSAVAPKNRGTLRVCDHYLERAALGKDAKLYFARKNACMQTRMGPASSNMNTIEKRYVNMGLRFSDYEISDPPPQGDGNAAPPKAPSVQSHEVSVKGGLEQQNPVDAVFVIGNGSVDCNEELKYALRSLDKNCKFVRDVYICGVCPPWVDKSKVKFLPWDDNFHHAKDANIVDKLRHACEHKGIAKRILFCSDDQFQTKECTWEDFAPRYLMEFDPKDKWYDEQHRIWHTRLRNTLLREVARRKAIGMAGGGVRYFQPHIWMPIDRDVFIDYAKWCGYETREDTIIASGYFNFANTAGVPNFDHVFLSGNETDIPEVRHVAYQDCSYRAAIKMLKKLFPEPSRFEISKDTGARVPSGNARPVSGNGSRSGYDPAPATADEMSRMLNISSKVREKDKLSGLLGEISRAEELRLFGVRGWRVVWRDIAARFDYAECNRNGAEIGMRSKEAQDIVDAYISDPEAMRTASFDQQTHLHAPSRDEMRKMVRASLRTKAQ
jgi:hypothetical protein